MLNIQFSIFKFWVAGKGQRAKSREFQVQVQGLEFKFSWMFKGLSKKKGKYCCSTHEPWAVQQWALLSILF